MEETIKRLKELTNELEEGLIKNKSSEDIRKIAEEARAKAEEARVIAEEARAKAESIREEIYLKLKKIFSEL
jgi:membrane protein involved in colicin uptake